MSAPLPPPRSEAVRVVVRVRPPSADEVAAGRAPAVALPPGGREVSLANPREPGAPAHVFTFDAAFGPDAGQAAVYAAAGAPIVESVLDGFNGTVFAYGQTGAGKSHTMEGTPGDPGVIPAALAHVFDAVAARAAPGRQALVRVSYLEIYNEEVRDLLVSGGGGGRPPFPHTPALELKEHPDSGVFVKGLTSCVVRSAGEAAAILAAGRARRAVGATAMNAASSRSHAIFTVTVETAQTGPAAGGGGSGPHIRAGKLHLVDLAGSERQAKTGAEGARLREAARINLSLSALGNVIAALAGAASGSGGGGGGGHIPYRDSKLTRLLADSLGGNTKTVMIANCGPADYNYDETLSTLRYASRAKSIRNQPRVNEDPKDALLREFQGEIARLRARLAEEEAKTTARGEPGGGGPPKQLGAPGVAAAQEAVGAFPGAGDAAAAAAAAEREKAALAAEIAALQEKLLVGDAASAAAQAREAQLRAAVAELEGARARQAAERGDEDDESGTATLLEGHYATMAEELDAKTRKLSKVWARLAHCEQEIHDLTDEFQMERDDMLDMIRHLHRQLKLKQLVIDEFVPTEDAAKIEARALWDDTNEVWLLRKLEVCGNRLRPLRPLSNLAPASAVVDSGEHPFLPPAPRWVFSSQLGADAVRQHTDNIAGLALEMPEEITELFPPTKWNSQSLF